MSAAHSIEFVPSGRGKAQCPADPQFPNGIQVGVLNAELSCLVKLPYPAPECGHFRIECHSCNMTLAITAAGRADDPFSVRVPCKMAVSGSIN